MFQGRIIIKKGKIVALEKFSGAVILDFGNENHNYKNCWAMPTFVDSHCHLSGIGEKLHSANLEKARSIEECIAIIINNPYFRGDWIYARGWNQENFYNNFMPDKSDLDNYFPDIPVFLLRIDGHCALVNTKALKLAGINKFTSSPPGGFIEKDKSGNPTGILIDTAADIVSSMIPYYTESQIEKMLLSAINQYHQYGITEIHDMDVDDVTVRVMQKLVSEGRFNIRCNVYLKAQNGKWLHSNLSQKISGNLNIIGLKFFFDGALGSRGALLINDYKDSPGNYGLQLIDDSTLYNYFQSGINDNWQIAIHAIGDAANHKVINLIERINKSGYKDYCVRIEHAQILKADDVQRMSDYGIIASVQPIHYVSDVKMIEKKLHVKDIKNAYRWKSLIDAGVTLIAGSDAPVESINPFYGIDAFLNRKPKFNNLYLKENISFEEALAAYITNPRKISGTINDSGAIEKNKNGDLIIINNNIQNSDSSSVNNTIVIATYFNGERVYFNVDYLNDKS